MIEGPTARRRWLVFLVAAGLILGVAAATIAIRVALWATIPYRDYGAAYAIVEIPPGTGVTRALVLLREHGVVRRFPLASAWLRLTNRARGLKAGEYAFSRPMNPGEVFDKIIAGDVYYHRVTVLEGTRSDEIFAQFARAGFGAEGEYREPFRDVSMIAALDPEAVDLEGYLFPDTYSLQKGTSPRAIVAVMVARFREVFQAEWIEQAREHGLTVRQAVILGSLIERETTSVEEDPLVSSVFHNRLRRGMRLQCDPTVIYALAMRNEYDGNIRKVDLEIDSLFNTYRYGGLTPAPIGNPGRSALNAAVAPAGTDYLYFVSMNTGRHHFSATLQEHNRAVWEYQKKPYRLKQAARWRRGGRGN
jgi:UPF0755 protein